MVVENLCGLPHKSDGVNIGAVSEIEARNPVIGRRRGSGALRPRAGRARRVQKLAGKPGRKHLP
jgi:hypothetical protein